MTTDPNALAAKAWEDARDARYSGGEPRAAIAAVYAPRLAELEKLVIALHAALAAHTCYGCPACPGDCSGACHPMIFCPTKQAKAAFFMFDRTALGASYDADA